MRKAALIFLLTVAAAVAGHAQTAYDAFLFSENDYEGTARTVAMGNAFTALGGDLGSINLNPAGSAVAKYSQFSITPSLTFTTNTTQGVSPYEDGSLPYFEKQYRNTSTSFSLPNFGITFNWETGRKSGLKGLTFGFVSNCSNSWNEDAYAAGRNSTTSFMASMAANATANGYLGSELNMDDAYDYYPWKDVVGYHSGMISTFGGYNDQFVGASELIIDHNGNTEIVLGGPLQQSYGRQVRGRKNEYIFNLGANISDFLYIGANVGITAMNYDYAEYFKEAAEDPSDFEIELDNGSRMYFDRMKYNYNYYVETSGIYGKFGFILTPGAGLRIGAAIQTPTATTVAEEWSHSGKTEFTESKYNASASSPYGSDKYSFREPWRANVGLAYTIGQFAVISADYEMCDYSTMKFKRESFSDYHDYFEDINNEIKTIYGMSHMFRLGAEMKFGAIAVRGGYGRTVSPEKADVFGDPLPKMATQNASFGLGFASKGSFFADAAVRYCFATQEYFMPYDDYMYDANGDLLAFAPEILNTRSAWKAMLTIGWRF
ncbi:MAG: hypothetical protein IKY48_05705 [Bacteroidales bacterium]|nr:hypothetical protein [Bacteroidales bacterium]